MSLLAALLAVVSSYIGLTADVATMTPHEKAALLVVSSPPAPAGVKGVLLHSWETDTVLSRDAMVFVDQEGGPVRAFRSLPPALAAAAYRSVDRGLLGWGEDSAGAAAGRRRRRSRASAGLAQRAARLAPLRGPVVCRRVCSWPRRRRPSRMCEALSRAWGRRASRPTAAIPSTEWFARASFRPFGPPCAPASRA